MAHERESRKDPAGNYAARKQACLDFIDNHPRIGWYIAGVATLNLVLNFIDAFNLWH